MSIVDFFFQYLLRKGTPCWHWHLDPDVLLGLNAPFFFLFDQDVACFLGIQTDVTTLEKESLKHFHLVHCHIYFLHLNIIIVWSLPAFPFHGLKKNQVTKFILGFWSQNRSESFYPHFLISAFQVILAPFKACKIFPFKIKTVFQMNRRTSWGLNRFPITQTFKKWY